jgi:putative hydrolase of the HAD superfamily
MMPKAVIMDLGNTIVENIAFSWEKGLSYLQEDVLIAPEKTALEEVGKYFKENGFDIRNKSMIEISFLNYLRYLKQTFGFRSGITEEEAEIGFMNHANTDRPYPDVRPVLDYFHSHDILLYVLSNSTFSSHALSYQLSQYRLLSYFGQVFSSADYLFRKPHPALFTMVSRYIMRNHHLCQEDITFIGNDYQIDILGSYRAGLKPIWLNQKGEDNTESVPCLIVRDYIELLAILKSQIDE